MLTQPAQLKSKFFYDDVMQVLSIAPPFFSFFPLSLGLVNHSSIRALNQKVMSAHTLTSGLGPLIL